MTSDNQAKPAATGGAGPNRFILIAVAIVVVVAAIGTAIYLLRPVATTPPSVADGFVAFTSFRSSDAPGTVFRKVADGSLRRVDLLETPIHLGTDVTYAISSKREMSAKQFLALVDESCQPLDQTVSASASGEVTINSVDAIREYTFDAEIDGQIAALKQRFVSGELTYRSSDSYWIIRETLKTSEVNYQSNETWLVAANLKGDLEKCVSAKGGVELNWGGSQNTSLIRKFDEPLRGWYLADRLVVDMPFGAGPATPPDIEVAPAPPADVPVL